MIICSNDIHMLKLFKIMEHNKKIFIINLDTAFIFFLFDKSMRYERYKKLNL